MSYWITYSIPTSLPTMNIDTTNQYITQITNLENKLKEKQKELDNMSEKTFKKDDKYIYHPLVSNKQTNENINPHIYKLIKEGWEFDVITSSNEDRTFFFRKLREEQDKKL